MKSLEKLISCLSDSEIRDFHWFAKRQRGDSKYVLLFEALRSQLKGKKINIEAKTGIPKANLPVYRNYLKGMIINALMYRRQAKSNEVSLVVKAQVLMEKGLWKDALSQLKKAKSKATLNEDFPAILDCFRLAKEIPVLEENDYFSTQEEADHLATYSEFLELRSIRAKLQKGLEDVNTPRPKISLIDSILTNSPSLFGGSQLRSIRAEAERHKVQRIVFVFKRQYEIGCHHAESYLKLREEHPEKFRGEELEHLRELWILSYVQPLADSKREMEAVLNLIETFPSKNPQIQAEKSDYSNGRRLVHAIETGDRIQGELNAVALLKQKDTLHTYLRPGRYQLLLFYLANFHCMIGDWPKAKDILNEIIYKTPRKSRSNTWQYARLLLLIVLFELEEFHDLETEIDRVNNYYRNHGTEFAFFKLLPSFFNRALTLYPTSKTEFWESTHSEIQNLKNDPFQSRPLNFVDFSGWLLSRIQQKSWLEIKKEAHLASEQEGTKGRSAFSAG